MNKHCWPEKKQAIIDQALASQKQEHPDFETPENPVMIDSETELSVVIDLMERVFQFEGKNFHVIDPKSFEAFNTVWDTGILLALSETELIPAVKLTGYASKEYALILEVERVTIQKSTVWTYTMVKDVCILVVFLNSVLSSFHLTLADGHFNNVTFHKGNPMFVDIGSIIPENGNHVLTELVFAGV